MIRSAARTRMHANMMSDAARANRLSVFTGFCESEKCLEDYGLIGQTHYESSIARGDFGRAIMGKHQRLAFELRLRAG